MNVFICTKPLQVMICMILSERYSPAELYVTSGFKGAREVCGRTEAVSRFFSEARYFETRNMAVLAALKRAPERIFLDSDFRYSTQLLLSLGKLMNPRVELNVYEEGVGTYRTDIIKPRTRFVHRLMGMACFLGDSRAVRRIHVFDAEWHAKAIPSLHDKRVQIRPTLGDWITLREGDVIDLLDPGFRLPTAGCEEVAYLYLMDAVAPDLSALKFLNEVGAPFIKPHPDEMPGSLEKVVQLAPKAHLLPASLPAEVVILELARTFEQVFVMHSGSSAFHYMSGTPNLREIPLPYAR